MHGHNYQIEIIVKATDNQLNGDGMLIDFGDLKKILSETLEPYDHKHLGTIPKGWSPNNDHVMPLPFKQTTAENLAKFWGEMINEKLEPLHLQLKNISVFESQSSKATWQPDE